MKRCRKGFVRIEDRCVSEEDYFNAILAKNHIARQLGRSRFAPNHTPYPADGFIMERLKEIEKVLGKSNQPSVEDEFETLWKY